MHHTEESLKRDLHALRIEPAGTLLVHSSMKAIGDVDGRADAVLNALCQYMRGGLLVFPALSFASVNAEQPVFDVRQTPCCVGILPERFRHRHGVVRSLHPTHSLAALGRGAEAFVAGHELFDTPCARTSPWGRLLDANAQIAFIGADLRSNTFVHGVEEWLGIPQRLTAQHQPLVSIDAEGTHIAVPSRRHTGSVSRFYGKVEPQLRQGGALHEGRFGSARTLVLQAQPAFAILQQLLSKNPKLFADDSPLH